MLTDFPNSFIDRLSEKFATDWYLNIPPYPKYVATLPCEIWMSVNWWQPEICIVINDKSQGSIAKHLSRGNLVPYKFIIQFPGERFFKIDEHLVKLQAKWLIVSYAPFALHFCPQRHGSCQISKITCVLWTETVTNRCYVIGRLMSAYYQEISNFCRLVWFDLLTDWRQQWLTDCWSCTAFCCDIFFFVTAVVYSQSWACFYMVVVNIFLLVN